MYDQPTDRVVSLDQLDGGPLPRIVEDLLLGQGGVPVGEQSARVRGSSPAAQGSDVAAILDQRGERYGKFCDHAGAAQRLKSVLRNHMGAKWDRLADDQKEAMEMIAHKLARIANGDPDYADSWVDIAGYAKLVADRLEGVSR